MLQGILAIALIVGVCPGSGENLCPSGIHQCKAQFIRTELAGERHKHVVDACEFFGTIGADNKHVRHRRQIPDHRIAMHIFPQRDGNAQIRISEFRGL